MAIKLVIVDDAPFIREIMRILLERAQMEVVGEATEGEEAIEVVKHTQPHVVLMDMVLPHMNGVDAAFAIGREYPSIKVIACSTLDEPWIRTKAKDAGCCSYILKPFTREDLLNHVYQVVGA